MKVDLCTWTKNGAKTLIPVLKRIDDAIPAEEVGEKIAVDDSSVDSTVKILKEFNWQVYPNRSGFINGGTTEALRHVRSKFFVSVEQDVLLCRNWWDIVPKNMEDKTVAVAQGIEISTNRAERGIEKYNLKKIRQMPLEKRSTLWKTIGNNIYRSEIIRKLGFVEDAIAMTPFYRKIIAHGFKWITDINAVSTHLRGDIFDAVRHTVTFYSLIQENTYLDEMRTYRYLAGLAFSPFKGLKMALATNEPEVPLLLVLRKMALTTTFFQRKQRRRYNLQKTKLTKP
jgi:glycosyltransferase involved in cell wall biosynthesis